ncbi:MAG TPA: DUF1772 domain-containing protein [Methyloceanibacter sp.]|jgi:hypothetical protein
MALRTVRFAALMLGALTLGMGLCHLLQLPARMGWDQYLWVGSTVQGGLYSLFGSAGAVIDILTVTSLGLLTYLVREHRRPGVMLALSAALLFAIGLLLWWVLVYPVNVELAKWANGPVPSDWTTYRSRWEWGHATISLFELLGFAALIASVLADTPRNNAHQ